MPTLLGKRYTCATCGAEILVIRPGAGTPECDGAPMTVAQARQLPSSD